MEKGCNGMINSARNRVVDCFYDESLTRMRTALYSITLSNCSVLCLTYAENFHKELQPVLILSLVVRWGSWNCSGAVVFIWCLLDLGDGKLYISSEIGKSSSNE
ncbi:hypothetical protein Fmac_022529 [Flemingia macrophylla]|uniref:Uncharacterized protein n=1 Tax=Flemingia macrophylla TaxID=520843 RepID=A0ABD1M0C6_9FABA